MRKLVIALALTTAVFAGSTGYFAHQLSVERGRSVAVPQVRPATLAPLADTPVGVAAVKKATPAPATAPTVDEAEMLTPTDDALSDAELRKMQAEYGKHFLAELADPERRQELLNERKLIIRNSYPRVDRVLGLTPDEYSRFIAQLAKQQLDQQEASAQCMVDPDCPARVPAEELRPMPDDTSREISELLGAARVQKFEQYKNTLGEREAISQLRNRLPDEQRLSDDSTEGLVAALAEERQSIYQEASQSGIELNGYGFGAGLVFITSGADNAQAQYESARRNSQRLRERAAQYLTPEQMRAFTEMQEEMLIGLRSMLRSKEMVTTLTSGADETN